jgi:hypothetical protein
MARMRSARRLLGMAMVLAAGLAGSAGTLAAQDARVLGRVTDGVGNPVAQATVTLVGENGAAAQATTSGASRCARDGWPRRWCGSPRRDGRSGGWWPRERRHADRRKHGGAAEVRAKL